MEGEVRVAPIVLFAGRWVLVGVWLELAQVAVLLVVDEWLREYDGVRLGYFLQLWEFIDGTEMGVKAGVGMGVGLVEGGSLILVLSLLMFKLHNNYIP